MTDMLVNLLSLPPLDSLLNELESSQIQIRRAHPFEITPVMEFVEEEFSIGWADEISVGFANKPVSVFVAISEGDIVGFAAYECTRRNFFGPIGVVEPMRMRGVGKALVLAALWGLREMGYVYGVLGGVGPVRFYENTVGAIVIPDSSPGIYSNLLKPS
ncbi:MAG TPA: GNAT family N-acetyltransferase [Pyrinomonadaceae bacterium]|nr:GNAT family N-acetyltransferase [Pyrinomonadaceae bacterium]